MTTVEQSRAWRSIVDVWRGLLRDRHERLLPFPKGVYPCLVDLDNAVYKGGDVNSAIDAVEKAAREAGIWTRPNGPTAHLKYGQTYVLEDTPFADAVNALRAVTPQPTVPKVIDATISWRDDRDIIPLTVMRRERDEALRQRDGAYMELAQVQAAALQALGRTVPQIGENPTLTVVNDLIIALRAERAKNRTPRE